LLLQYENRTPMLHHWMCRVPTGSPSGAPHTFLMCAEERRTNPRARPNPRLFLRGARPRWHRRRVCQSFPYQGWIWNPNAILRAPPAGPTLDRQTRAARRRRRRRRKSLKSASNLCGQRRDYARWILAKLPLRAGWRKVRRAWPRRVLQVSWYCLIIFPCCKRNTTAHAFLPIKQHMWLRKIRSLPSLCSSQAFL